MSIPTRDFELDIWEKPFGQLNLVQHESAGRRVRFRLMDDDVPYDLSGLNVALEMRKPDGHIVTMACTVEEAAEGIVSAVIVSQAVIVSGYGIIQFRFDGDTQLTKTFAQKVYVSPSINADGVAESTTEFSHLHDLIGQAETVISIADTELWPEVVENAQYFSDLAGAGRTVETVKANADDIADLAGTGRTNQTVKGNADDIADLAAALETDKTLTVSDAAADAKVTGDKVGELKSVMKVNLTNKRIESTNHLDYSKLSVGKMTADGNVDTTATVRKHTDYIQVEPGTKVRLIVFSDGTKTAVAITNVAAFDENKNVLSAKGTDTSVTAYTVPDGVWYIRLSSTGSYFDSAMITFNTTASDAVWEDYFEPYYTEDFLKQTTKEKLSALNPTAINDLISTFDDLNIVIHPQTNFLNLDALTAGSMATDGTISSSDTRHYTDYIPVTPGDVVRFLWYNNSTFTAVNMAVITAFDSSKNVLSAKGMSSAGPSFTIQSGVAFVRVTVVDSYLPTAIITLNTRASEAVWSDYNPTYVSSDFDILTNETKEKINDIPAVAGRLTKKVDSLASGNAVSFSAPMTMRNVVYGFDADISTFSVLYFGRNKTSGYGAFIKIDSTNITPYIHIGSSDTQLADPQAHGLTISGHISVLIETNSKGSGKVTLSTSTGIFTSTVIPFAGSNGDVSLLSDGTALTNINVSFFSPKWNADYILFWNSYEDYVSKYMVDEGAGDICFDAYPGRASAGGKTSFDLMMEIRKPKAVIWGLGMNNADSSSAVNATWDSVRQAVQTYCDDNGIELIYLTIPNTPTVRNTYKNAIIKASGYRYVDVAEAVGASEAGATWYTGLLSSDNVHPTSLGSKIIANVICAQIPEIIE